MIERSSDSHRSVLVRHAGEQPAGTELTYDDIALVLGIEEEEDFVKTIHMAKADSWLELGETYGKALVNIPTVGYEVVTGARFFKELLRQVHLVLKRTRRIARRLGHVPSEELTCSQRDARATILARLRVASTEIRRDYKRGFHEDLLDGEEGDEQ